MELFYQSYGTENSTSATPPIIIIPGLFGSTVNWRSFAKKLSQDYHVVVIDQRNHGESPHANSHTYADMVSDLLSLCDHLKFDKVVVCGHSMGGKVAMLFALLHPERVASLAVLDIAPIQYKHSHAPYLRALMDVDLLSLSSRSEAEKTLKSTIADTSTRLFLMQSLVGKPGEYRWRLNLPVLLRDMPEITGFPLGDVDGVVSNIEAIFILGGESDYVSQEDVVKIKTFFPKAKFSTIDGVGHWLHAERPKEMLEVLMEFF